jgi:GTPase SAR1 family protein
VKEIYASEPFETARVHHKSEFKEGLNHAMEGIENLQDEGWLPSNTDILYARGRTSGSMETKFVADGYDFTLVDVGGQIQERRKWAAQHNDLNGILFFAATDEFDVPSDEQEGKTRLQVSLDVWEDTIHAEAIAGKVAVILFLNKCDLLEDRLKQAPKSLKKVYKKYNGGGDVGKALEFLQQLYISRIREGTDVTNSQIYVHQTCALDTRQMQVVFQSVRDFVVTQRMSRANLI